MSQRHYPWKNKVIDLKYVVSIDKFHTHIVIKQKYLWLFTKKFEHTFYDENLCYKAYHKIWRQWWHYRNLHY